MSFSGDMAQLWSLIDYHHRRSEQHEALSGSHHMQEAGKHASWAILLTKIAKDKMEEGVGFIK